MENYYKNARIAAEYRQSDEGKRLGGYIELLNEIARTLLNFHKEETCWGVGRYFRILMTRASLSWFRLFGSRASAAQHRAA